MLDPGNLLATPGLRSAFVQVLEHVDGAVVHPGATDPAGRRATASSGDNARVITTERIVDDLPAAVEQCARTELSRCGAPPATRTPASRSRPGGP